MLLPHVSLPKDGIDGINMSESSNPNNIVMLLNYSNN